MMSSHRTRDDIDGERRIADATASAPARQERRRELDLVRMLVVVGLVFFHSARLFDTGDFYVKNDPTSEGVDVAVAFLATWGMPLLFVIAGMGMWYSLRSRTTAGFAGERVRRLLVPLVFGVLVIVPPQVWTELRGRPNYGESYGDFLRRFFDVELDLWQFPFVIMPDPVTDLFEYGHLWFVVILFAYSLLLVPVIAFLRSDVGSPLLGRLASAADRPGMLMLSAVPFAVLDAVLGSEEHFAAWNRHTYGVFILYGFVLASDRRFGSALHRWRKHALALGATTFVAAGALFATAGDAADPLVDRDLVGYAVRTMLGLDSPDNIPSPSGRVEAWIAEGALWAERFDRADELLVVYRQHAELDLDVYPPSTLHALGLTAYSLVAQGRLTDADRILSRARSLIDRLRSGHLVHTLYAQLAEAQAHWDRGELSEAESTLVEIQQHADRFGDVPVTAMHAMLRSRNRWSLGDHTGAFAILDAAEVMPTGRVIGGHFARRITLEKCRLDILAGDHEAAALRLPDRSSRLTAANEPLRDLTAIARIAIALGEDHPTIDELAAVDTAVPGHQIDLALLRAARFCARGEGADAADSLAQGMRVAAESGMTQRLADERQLFGPAHAEAAARSGFLAGDDVAGPALIDPLTERELEVLTKLTTQMTYQDIADELFVSQNTVKSHTAAIYRKLAVARRTEAVNRARELGLLSA